MRTEIRLKIQEFLHSKSQIIFPDLQLKTLLPEGGQVSVAGHISALIYEEPRVGGLWKRLLG